MMMMMMMMMMMLMMMMMIMMMMMNALLSQGTLDFSCLSLVGFECDVKWNIIPPIQNTKGNTKEVPFLPKKGI